MFLTVIGVITNIHMMMMMMIKSLVSDICLVQCTHGNVTKDRLDPCQGSNERKVTGAGMGSGCGVVCFLLKDLDCSVSRA